MYGIQKLQRHSMSIQAKFQFWLVNSEMLKSVIVSFQINISKVQQPKEEDHKLPLIYNTST